MKKIDAHQHFWKYSEQSHAWIDDKMAVLKRDFYPEDLASVLAVNAVDACVAVQAEQSEAETLFLLDLAKQNSFIKGVVGWVDFQDKNIEERLRYFKQFPLLKGFRHILQAESPDFFSNPAFIKGISLLEKYGFTYDILIYQHQLEVALNFVQHFPNQSFVLNHLAKPLIKDKKISDWNTGIRHLAKHQNIYCKISGMATEAHWQAWTPEDFTDYLDVVVNEFGIERLMFGSDWPVCLLATSYEKWVNVVSNYFKPFTQAEQEKLFGLNAIKFYNLE